MWPIRLGRGEDSAASTTAAAIAREIDRVESIWAVGLVSPIEEAWEERDDVIESRLSYKCIL